MEQRKRLRPVSLCGRKLSSGRPQPDSARHWYEAGVVVPARSCISWTQPWHRRLRHSHPICRWPHTVRTLPVHYSASRTCSKQASDPKGRYSLCRWCKPPVVKRQESAGPAGRHRCLVSARRAFGPLFVGFRWLTPAAGVVSYL